jgi:hypothetical protein
MFEEVNKLMDTTDYLYVDYEETQMRLSHLSL